MNLHSSTHASQTQRPFCWRHPSSNTNPRNSSIHVCPYYRRDSSSRRLSLSMNRRSSLRACRRLLRLRRLSSLDTNLCSNTTPFLYQLLTSNFARSSHRPLRSSVRAEGPELVCEH